MTFKLEFFRVLPVLLFFIAAAYACTERTRGWTIMVAGLVLNGILWLVISLYMSRNHPALSKRPQKSQCYFWNQKDISIENGMPSGHCQSAAFFGTWLVLMAIFYRVPLGVLMLALFISGFIIVGMIYSRVAHYKCHTLPQAAVGTSIGCITALLFYPYL